MEGLLAEGNRVAVSVVQRRHVRKRPRVAWLLSVRGTGQGVAARGLSAVAEPQYCWRRRMLDLLPLSPTDLFQGVFMATHRSGAVTFKGNPLTLVGEELAVGSAAPAFDLACYQDGGMQQITNADLQGKPAFISVVPSLDTPVCQVQTKTFNERLAALGDKVTALTVSLDLPFAMNRFCGAESITAMKCGSDYMDRSFGEGWGVLIDELKILARAVFVLDAEGVVRYAEVVPEVASEPNYDAALAALEGLVAA